MTVAQMQVLLENVRETQNNLISMITALELAIELFDELSPEDNVQLVADWRKQLKNLRTLHTCLPNGAPHGQHAMIEQSHLAERCVG